MVVLLPSLLLLLLRRTSPAIQQRLPLLLSLQSLSAFLAFLLSLLGPALLGCLLHLSRSLLLLFWLFLYPVRGIMTCLQSPPRSRPFSSSSLSPSNEVSLESPTVSMDHPHPHPHPHLPHLHPNPSLSHQEGPSTRNGSGGLSLLYMVGTADHQAANTSSLPSVAPPSSSPLFRPYLPPLGSSNETPGGPQGNSLLPSLKSLKLDEPYSSNGNPASFPSPFPSFSLPPLSSPGQPSPLPPLSFNSPFPQGNPVRTSRSAPELGGNLPIFFPSGQSPSSNSSEYFQSQN